MPSPRKLYSWGIQRTQRDINCIVCQQTDLQQVVNVSFFEDRFHDFGTKDDKELTFPEGLNDLTETLIHPPQVDLDGALEEEGRTEPVGVTYEDRFLEEVNNLGTKRNRRPPDRYQPDGCFITESLITDLDEPKSLDEALNSQHSEQWKAALQSEYDSLIEN